MKKSRPSPSQHASETTPGTVLKGNDKAMWICKDINGTHRWVRSASTKGKSYVTRDNGGAPFKLFVDKSAVTVYVRDMDAVDQISDCYRKAGRQTLAKFLAFAYTKKVWGTRSAQNIFVGGDKRDKFSIGNSNLIQINETKYVFVGDSIYTFQTTDIIQKYFSPIGNSGVPYPWAVDEKYTYLLNESVFIPNEKLVKVKDPYAYYYSLSVAESKKIKKENRIKIIKTIVERICG